MHRFVRLKMLLITGLALFLCEAVALPAPQHAAAQCGADASSCRRCHEGDQALPVDTLGAWHSDHAGQDFCQLCHGGDKLTDEAAAAHATLIDPLGDQAAARCAACHPSDTPQKIDAYTTLLASTSAGAPVPAEAPASADQGYDWRNMTLAGVAGMLTVLSGVVVWSFERPRRNQ